MTVECSFRSATAETVAPGKTIIHARWQGSDFQFNTFRKLTLDMIDGDLVSNEFNGSLITTASGNAGLVIKDYPGFRVRNVDDDSDMKVSSSGFDNLFTELTGDVDALPYFTVTTAPIRTIGDSNSIVFLRQ